MQFERHMIENETSSPTLGRVSSSTLSSTPPNFRSAPFEERSGIAPDHLLDQQGTFTFAASASATSCHPSEQ